MVAGLVVARRRFSIFPTGLLYFFHDASGDQGISADTNGCAAGNRVEEAIVHGFLELIERDACAIWWYNRLRRAEIDLDELGDDYLRDVRARYAAMGRGLRVLDVTSDLGIPAVVAVAHWQKDARDCVRFAAGAHFDLRIATLRAVTKLNQSLTSIGWRTVPAANRTKTEMRCRCRCARRPICCAARQGARPARAVVEIRKPRSARAGAGLRQARQALRARFPRARPDPTRHSGACCSGDRSGTAASLSSFRARPAL